jgi:outer membrane protein insertion porin family/translocation and assembly module TamA
MARAQSWQTLAAILMLVAGAGPLRAQSRSPAKGPTPEVVQLTIKGVKNVDQHDLEKSIQTQVSRCVSLFVQPFCWISHSPIFWQKFYLDRDEFRRDVLRIRVYYWKRGFREATVDTTIAPKGKGVAVTFDVHEGEPTIVSALRIDYDTTLLSVKQKNKLNLMRVGQPLNLLTLDSTRLNFQSEMWQRGYADAIVDTAIAVNDSARRAAVAMRVYPNWPTTVGNIVILGNKQVATQTILDMLLLRPGRPFIRNDMLESQRTLYTSNLFRLASILPPTGDSIKRIEIQVVEAPLHGARVGASLDNVNFSQLEAGYSAHNLFGGARRLDLNASVGNLGAKSLNGVGPFAEETRLLGVDNPGPFLQPTWSASIDFNQPAFLRRPANQAGLGVFAHRRSEPSIYIDRGYGLTATFTRQLASRAPASLNYRYEVTRVEAGDIYFCVNYGVCDTTTIRTLRTHQNLSPLSLTAFIDRSDQPFTPTKGYVARIDAEHASRYTLSDYRYNRAFLDAAAYWHPSLRPQVVAGHLRLGIVRAMTSSTGDTVLHPRTRFYAGGAMSVRGYGENQLGPRVLTISADSLRAPTASDPTVLRCPSNVPIQQCNPNLADLKNSYFVPRPTGGTSLVEGSAEVRFPTGVRHLDAAVFVDGAIVGNSALQAFSDLRSIADFARGTSAITPGAGIRYNSPVGPIRVDLGYNPRLTENLAVVTNTKVNGEDKLIALQTPRTYTSGRNTFLGRLVLHLSIGQAY